MNLGQFPRELLYLIFSYLPLDNLYYLKKQPSLVGSVAWELFYKNILLDDEAEEQEWERYRKTYEIDFFEYDTVLLNYKNFACFNDFDELCLFFEENPNYIPDLMVFLDQNLLILFCMIYSNMLRNVKKVILSYTTRDRHIFLVNHQLLQYVPNLYYHNWQLGELKGLFHIPKDLLQGVDYVYDLRVDYFHPQADVTSISMYASVLNGYKSWWIKAPFKIKLIYIVEGGPHYPVSNDEFPYEVEQVVFRDKASYIPATLKTSLVKSLRFHDVCEDYHFFNNGRSFYDVLELVISGFETREGLFEFLDDCANYHQLRKLYLHDYSIENDFSGFYEDRPEGPNGYRFGRFPDTLESLFFLVAQIRIPPNVVLPSSISTLHIAMVKELPFHILSGLPQLKYLCLEEIDQVVFSCPAEFPNSLEVLILRDTYLYEGCLDFSNLLTLPNLNCLAISMSHEGFPQSIDGVPWSQVDFTKLANLKMLKIPASGSLDMRLPDSLEELYVDCSLTNVSRSMTFPKSLRIVWFPVVTIEYDTLDKFPLNMEAITIIATETNHLTTPLKRFPRLEELRLYTNITDEALANLQLSKYTTLSVLHFHSDLVKILELSHLPECLIELSLKFPLLERINGNFTRFKKLQSVSFTKLNSEQLFSNMGRHISFGKRVREIVFDDCCGARFNLIQWSFHFKKITIFFEELPKLEDMTAMCEFYDDVSTTGPQVFTNDSRMHPYNNWIGMERMVRDREVIMCYF